MGLEGAGAKAGCGLTVGTLPSVAGPACGEGQVQALAKACMQGRLGCECKGGASHTGGLINGADSETVDVSRLGVQTGWWKRVAT